MAQKERMAFSTQCSFKARGWIAALEAEWSEDQTSTHGFPFCFLL